MTMLGSFFGMVVTASKTSLSISSNQTNLNLRTWAVTNGWAGVSALEITVNSGVGIYATSTANAGLVIDGTYPSGVTLIVASGAFISGKYGAKGIGANGAPGYENGANGQAGGLALSVSSAVTINNAGTIGGGGGGGGGGRGGNGPDYGTTGGGSGGNGQDFTATAQSGGAGYGGWATAGGAGGSYGTTGTSASGVAGYIGSDYYGKGGNGGVGGAAVSGNSNITWAATGTRSGSIS
jgi:hypothetical protein